MPIDLFVKVGDIKGESQDDRHRDQIVVVSWSWGATASLAPGAGSGGGAGKTTFNDVTFTHQYDKSSPLLMKACATGQHIPEATLTVRRPGTATPDFLVIKLSDVLVTAVAPSADRDHAVVESVSLRSGKIDVSYSAQKPDGSLDAAVQFRFDIAANRPF